MSRISLYIQEDLANRDQHKGILQGLTNFVARLSPSTFLRELRIAVRNASWRLRERHVSAGTMRRTGKPPTRPYNDCQYILEPLRRVQKVQNVELLAYDSSSIDTVGSTAFCRALLARLKVEGEQRPSLPMIFYGRAKNYLEPYYDWSYEGHSLAYPLNQRIYGRQYFA